jgi:hypothetical protein
MNLINKIIGFCTIDNPKKTMYETLRVQNILSNYDIHFLRITSDKIPIESEHLLEYD